VNKGHWNEMALTHPPELDYQHRGDGTRQREPAKPPVHEPEVTDVATAAAFETQEGIGL
jgi:hypothetical protein